MKLRRVRNRRGLWPPMAMTAICVLLGLSVPISAAAVTMAWDPNREADLAGYKIHIGPSPGVYTQSMDIGHVTTFTVPGLLAGETYYLAITAYDIFANESGFSSEVSTAIPKPPEPAPVSTDPGGGTVEDATPPSAQTTASTSPTSGVASSSGGSGSSGTSGNTLSSAVAKIDDSAGSLVSTGGSSSNSGSPSATAGRLHRKGQRLYEQGRYSGAIRAYRQAQRQYGELRNAEQRAAVFEDMARAFEAQGNFEAAAARYERARRIRERSAN